MKVTKDSIFVLDKTILRRTSMARHSRRVVYPDTPEDPLDILTHRYSDEYHSTGYSNV